MQVVRCTWTTRACTLRDELERYNQATVEMNVEAETKRTPGYTQSL